MRSWYWYLSCPDCMKLLYKTNRKHQHLHQLKFNGANFMSVQGLPHGHPLGCKDCQNFKNYNFLDSRLWHYSDGSAIKVESCRVN